MAFPDQKWINDIAFSGTYFVPVIKSVLQ